MFRIIVTVALLLISGLTGYAAASERNPDETSQKARKVAAYLENNGINNPRLVKLISTMGNRMEGRNIRLTEEKFETGRLVLHYKARPKISTRQLELKFQPTYSKRTEFVATTNSVMYNYKLQF